MANSFFYVEGEDRRKVRLVDNGDGTFSIDTNAVVQTGDIEIGAVEIKNSSDDTRATVGANGLHVDVQASSGVGSLTETAPATDTASSGLNGRLQRVAQRLTSLIALIPAALGAGGGLKVDGSGTALPVSGTFYQATQPVSVADGSDAVAGVTTGAAVVTDANGTLQQYLRGLVKLVAAIISVKIDQTTPGTTDRVTAKVDKVQGAANMANGQVAASVSAGTLVAARATRRSAVIKNMDTSITVYIGVATVTAANGLPLLAGESVTIDWVGLIQVIAASGTPSVAYCETFD